MPEIRFTRRACGRWVMAFLLLFYSATPAFAQIQDESQPLNVAIVLSENGGSYAEFSHALDRLLSGQNVSHKVINDTEPIPASGLVVVVGLKAAKAVAASGAPSVLNVYITKDSHNKLLRDYPRRSDSNSLSAIFLDQPIHRQVHLIKAIFPDKHNVGILYSTPPKELAELRQKMNEHNLVLNEQLVDETTSLGEALQDILLGRSEMLLALPDAAVYNDSTMRNIMLATYRRGMPFIGFSSGYVKAGALCAVVTTPEQIAGQAAALIRQFANTHELPAAQYPREFEVLVNEQVARSLDLHVKSASALHDEMMKQMEQAP